MLDDFKLAGFVPFPLSITPGDDATRGKIPAHRGWVTKDYSAFTDPAGFNVGFRLKPDQLVIDVDPRNGGDDSLARLCEAVGCDLRNAPTTITGGDGLHLFYTKPSDLAISMKLADFPGIEFKTHVGLVVAPGSMHFKSGKHYRVDRSRPHICFITEAPAALLALLAKPERAERSSEAGQIDGDQLARLLAFIDATEYGVGKRAEWLALSAACHDATGGWGEEAWRDWCMSDPDFETVDAIESGEKLWESFKGGKPGGATIGTLFRAAQQGGGEAVVREIQAEIRAAELAADDYWDADPSVPSEALDFDGPTEISEELDFDE
jgi:hypothetical protein